MKKKGSNYTYVNGDKSFGDKRFEDSLKKVVEGITFFPINTESRIFEERTKEVRESSMEMARVETLQGDKSRLSQAKSSKRIMNSVCRE